MKKSHPRNSKHTTSLSRAWNKRIKKTLRAKERQQGRRVINQS